MKKITVTNVNEATETGENKDKRLQKFELEGEDSMDASDGYHTFTELYEHRITLFIALCRSRLLADRIQDMHEGEHETFNHNVWRSKLHSDGTSFDDWFIIGIGKEKGKQITYHLPIVRWDDVDFAETLERAPEFDGHTSEDVLERLNKL